MLPRAFRTAAVCRMAVLFAFLNLNAGTALAVPQAPQPAPVPPTLSAEQPAQVPGLAGHWEGKIETPGTPLAVDVDLEALPYDERDGAVRAIPFRSITTIGPAGSINSSAEEMAQWVKLHLGDGKAGERRIVSPAGLAELHAPQMVLGAPAERLEISPASYGLGWFVDTYRGHSRVEHGGNIDGFSALVSLFPQDGFGLVVLTNRDGTGLPEILVRHAADRLLGLPPIDWNAEGLAKRAAAKAATEQAKANREAVRRPGTRPAHALAEYAGDYEHPGYGTLRVAQRGKGLEMTYHGITAPLEHWHYEVWNAAPGAQDPVLEGTKVIFATDVNGEVAALSAPFEPSVADILFKKKPDARLSDPAYLARFVGEYDLAGQAIAIALAGNELTLATPGQPVYHLVPGLGEVFTLKEVSVVSVRFQKDAQGNVTAALVSQPQGVFTAKRLK